MAKSPRILLVEDDVNLGFLLVDFLEHNGFDVKLYRDGEAGLEGFRKVPYDLSILDVMLPKMDGFELLESIKQERKEAPVIMLTARTMDEDKIRGFHLGVDDYVTKPFNEQELLCRIQAVLNRTMSGRVEEELPDQYEIGSYSFVSKNQLLERGAEKRRLTKTESHILQVLCRHLNEVVTRKEIMETVWGTEDYFVGRSLDVFVSKLRKYLTADPSVTIESVPRVGLSLLVKD